LVKMSMYSSSILSTDSNDSKIPKPDGEAGRLACGGYNLERALNWDSSRFKLLRVRSMLLNQSHIHTHDRTLSIDQSTVIATLARASQAKHLQHWILLRQRYVCGFYNCIYWPVFRPSFNFRNWMTIWGAGQWEILYKCNWKIFLLRSDKGTRRRIIARSRPSITIEWFHGMCISNSLI
jgi:hypothetical protein